MRRLLAVLGRNVSRSLSPRLHAAAAAALGLDLAYVPVSVPHERGFVRAVDALAALGAVGANVTIPFKDAALRLSTALDPAAREIGAVNTLSFRADGLHGANTDGPGLVDCLRARSADRLDGEVWVLGAGGVARAAVWAAARAGAARVRVFARREASAAALAELAAVVVPDAPDGSRGLADGLDALEARARQAPPSLVISAVPAEARLVERLLAALPTTAPRPQLHDLAYAGADAPTSAVQVWRAAGGEAWDGRALLVAQAALAFSAWTSAPVDAVRAAMIEVLPEA